MSFYHILLSNAAKSRFPDNCAGKFTIPIDDAQQLTGEWEVAVAQIAHSNCLYTFNNEVVTVKEKLLKAFQCEKGCRVFIPRWSKIEAASVRKFMIDFLIEACENIVKYVPDKEYKFYTREVQPGWIVAFSNDLSTHLGHYANAFTSDGNYPSNHHFRYWEKTIPYEVDKYYVDFIPQNDKTLLKKIVLKSKNSDMIPETLIRKFNYLMKMDGRQIATMSIVQKSGHIIIEKLHDDDCPQSNIIKCKIN